MIANIKARYSNGVLTPLEPIDLEEGDEVTLRIENGPARDTVSQKSEEKLSPDTDAPSISELLREIRESATKVSWDDLPSDGAKNLKHYLYGWPKENER